MFAGVVVELSREHSKVEVTVPIIKMDKYGGYLGILKWSLKHTDGTSENPDLKKMSPEVLEEHGIYFPSM